LPQQLEDILEQADELKALALKYVGQDHCLFMGRGPLFPIALEGALKLKEISYLHAEGYSGGELKHGPIAMIDKGTPLVALALQDKYYPKMISNIQEVLSRQASVIAITTAGEQELAKMVPDVITIPQSHPALTPLLAVVPLQLFSYYMADAKGHDVDQPRNLAKSVTVE
jgi:glucosamine--fructose-6-phosphate aminotransferase (isomerizing)